MISYFSITEAAEACVLRLLHVMWRQRRCCVSGRYRRTRCFSATRRRRSNVRIRAPASAKCRRLWPRCGTRSTTCIKTWASYTRPLCSIRCCSPTGHILRSFSFISPAVMQIDKATDLWDRGVVVVVTTTLNFGVLPVEISALYKLDYY